MTNASALFGVEFYLPGVFMDNPYRGTVNGALWTLRFELWMYAILLVAWLTTAARGWNRMFATIVLALVAFGTMYYWQKPALVPPATSGLGKLGWLTPMFFLGVGAHLLRAWIPLNRLLAAGAALVLIGAGFAGPLYFKTVYPICLAYLVLFVVYGTPVIEWVQHRDYSYGFYIYAFVVQQTLAHVCPGIGTISMVIASTLATLVLAMASWRVVEKPMLRRLDSVTHALRGLARRVAPKSASPARSS